MISSVLGHSKGCGISYMVLGLCPLASIACALRLCVVLLGWCVAIEGVCDMQACDLSGSFILPAPHRERRSAITFDVPGRITNLYDKADISQLHRVKRSIVDLVALTLVVDGSKMYFKLLWSQ